MKVKELIEQLSKQDQEKEVMIQQGEEFDYMAVYTIRPKELLYEDEPTEVVVIEYM